MSTMSSMDYNDIETTTVAPVSDSIAAAAAATTKPLKIIRALLQKGLKEATVEAAATTTTSTTANANHREHLPHQKITFEIPTHHDLEHIDKLHNFNTLLKRIGNVMSFDASQLNNDAHNSHTSMSPSSSSSSLASFNDLVLQTQNPTQHLISSAEISKSVVLDLADLKAHNDNDFSLERFFAGADMHSIINYLWIGVVSSLIILSVIFIVFSCYFYRKFREWKKCNKDIRAHGSNNNNGNNNNGELHYSHGLNESLSFCEQAGNGGGVAGVAAAGIIGAAYYQIESPPCYTIATGLPSYDEALLHHHQHQQAHYYNYAFKFMYPRLAAKHQQQHHQQLQQSSTSVDGHFIGNCKKLSTATAASPDNDNSTNTEMHKMLQYYNNVKITKHCSDVQQLQQRYEGNMKVSALLLKQSAPPAYNVATTTSSATASATSATLPRSCVAAAPSTESIIMDDEHIEICIDEQSLPTHVAEDCDSLVSICLLNAAAAQRQQQQHMNSDSNLLDVDVA